MAPWMDCKPCILVAALAFSALFAATSSSFAMDDDLEADVEFYLRVLDVEHKEVAARINRTIAQGERLYPIIEQRLSEPDELNSVSAGGLLSLARQAPGDKSKILPAIREFAISKRAQQDPYVLWNLAWTFSAIGDETDVPFLLGLLDHQDLSVRARALGSLGQIGRPEEVAEIERILAERAARLGEAHDRETQARGRAAIIRIHHRAGELRFEQVLADIPAELSDEAETAAALEIIAESGGDDPALRPLIRRQLLAPSETVRRHAVSALAAVAGSKELPALLAMLHDPHHAVRLEAARALGEHGNQSVLGAIEIWRRHAAETDRDRPENEKWLGRGMPRRLEEAEAKIRQRMEEQSGP